MSMNNSRYEGWGSMGDMERSLNLTVVDKESRELKLLTIFSSVKNQNDAILCFRGISSFVCFGLRGFFCRTQRTSTSDLSRCACCLRSLFFSSPVVAIHQRLGIY